MAQKHQNGDGAVQSGKGILSKGRGRPTNLAKRATKGEQKCVCWFLCFFAQVLVILVSGFVVRVWLLPMEAGGRVLGC